MSRVHYWELSNYNGGKLIGRWFDLDGLTHDEHLQEITDWMEELSETTGDLCEEWIVGDTEDIPDGFVGVYHISSEFFDLQEAASRSGLDIEVFMAGIECGIDINDIDDAYAGSYANDIAYAEEYIDSTGMLSELPENLRFYFDVELFTQDLMREMYSHDGHYFYSNY